jgi:Meckelin (Transmembrane protein 67)
MPKDMLGMYKDLYQKNIINEISNAINSKTNRYNQVQQVMTREKALPTGFRIDELKDSGQFMNRLMQTYIERVRMEPRQYIRERGACARWLGYTPDVKNIEIPVLFRDPYSNFTNYMLQGLDFDFLTLHVLIVTLIDLVD